jgi:anhydro-N-acetylmuramic acid kinase
MFKETYNVIGVMSGTSLDGVDLAHIHFSISDGKWDYTILDCETIGYDPVWLNNLKKAIDFSSEKLLKLNEDYSVLLGNFIKSFINKHHIKNLDAVCSHGHTILHQPQNGFTLQIGNLPK